MSEVGLALDNPNSTEPLRKQLKPCGVNWPHDRKVTMIKSGDPRLPEALGKRHDTRVSTAKRQIDVGVDQFCDAKQISVSNRLHKYLALSHQTKEVRLGISTELAGNEVANFSDHKRSRHNLTRFITQKVRTGCMIRIAAVRRC